MKTFSKFILGIATAVALIAMPSLAAAEKIVTTKTLSAIPKSFWGKYCPEGFKSCEPREFYVSANSVWSESDGGCAQVVQVEKTGDALNLKCQEAPNVTLQPLSKGKIRFEITGEAPKVIQKVK
ncbi:MAG: hypothetical protein U1F27_09110 [Turneriella sp.]